MISNNPCLKKTNSLTKIKILNKSVTFDVRKVDSKSSENDWNPEEVGYELPEEFKGHHDNHQNDDKYLATGDILMRKQRPFWKKVFDHIRHSSLFIFHKDWRFRKFLIKLVVSPETLLEYRNMKKENALFNLAQEENYSPKNSKVNFNK